MAACVAVRRSGAHRVGAGGVEQLRLAFLLACGARHLATPAQRREEGFVRDDVRRDLSVLPPAVPRRQSQQWRRGKRPGGVATVYGNRRWGPRRGKSGGSERRATCAAALSTAAAACAAGSPRLHPPGHGGKAERRGRRCTRLRRSEGRGATANRMLDERHAATVAVRRAGRQMCCAKPPRRE